MSFVVVNFLTVDLRALLLVIFGLFFGLFCWLLFVDLRYLLCVLCFCYWCVCMLFVVCCVSFVVRVCSFVCLL